MEALTVFRAFEAIIQGRLDDLKALLDGGLSVNAVFPNMLWNWTLLQFASATPHSELVRFLVERGADLEIRVTSNPGSYRAYGNEETEEEKLLYKIRRVQMSRPFALGSTALFFAASVGVEENVKCLLDGGADLTTTNERHGTALQVALANGHQKIAQLLISRGASFQPPPRIKPTDVTHHEQLRDFIFGAVKERFEYRLLDPKAQPYGRTLKEYLSAMLRVVQESRRERPTYATFARIIEESFDADAPGFDPAWNKFTSEPEDYEGWSAYKRLERQLCYYIASLHAMEASNEINRKDRYFGVRGWYQFEVKDFLYQCTTPLEDKLEKVREDAATLKVKWWHRYLTQLMYHPLVWRIVRRRGTAALHKWSDWGRKRGKICKLLHPSWDTLSNMLWYGKNYE